MANEGGGAGTMTTLPTGPVPKGAICLFSGTLNADGYPLVDGVPNLDWALCNGAHGTPDLRDTFIKSVGAGEQPGGTGGSATHTHDNHPALSHSGAGVDAHNVTQPAAHSNHVFTQAVNHVFTQAVNHSNHVFTQAVNHVFTQAADHGAHTHTITHTHDIAHTHGTSSKVGTSTANIKDLALGTTASGASSAASTGNPNATLTHSGAGVDAHSGAGVDAHSAHTGAGVDAHTGAGVDAHSAHTGTAVANHTVTQPDQHAAQSHSLASNEPAYYKLAYIMRL